jgi:FAD synthetase
MLRSMTRAACIIIGDEILSGKIRDTNIHLIIDLLREGGVTLCRIVTLGDDPADIAEEIARCSARYDYVFTSGGLGPTHDDRTIEGIARGFDRPVVHHPELERLVRGYWGTRVNEAALKMAEVPEGATLLESADNLFPVVLFRNVFILPGVPQLFAAKLQRVRQEISGTHGTLRSIYLSSDETSIAAALAQIEREIAGIKIGSYPRIGDPDCRVQVTVEGPVSDDVHHAVQRLLEVIPRDYILRVE